MARKKPKINLSQPIQPRTGDLEKLFGGPDAAEQGSGLQLLALRLDTIRPDPDQPRQTFSDESLQELANSIAQDGVIQPIEVTEIAPEQYLIVHGERRWRAAQLAGLETIPAVVRRRDYDVVTRFVRQMVENIQREDLNDVDRAAALLRLRDLMQEELDTAVTDNISTDEPWSKKVTWAKVGKRLGYSRQRIHQLIQLLKLPDEIKTAVREGTLSERDTRIYQGLKLSQQRDLHRARMAGELSQKEIRQVAAQLKQSPDRTVTQVIKVLRTPPAATAPAAEPSFETSLSETQAERPSPVPPRAAEPQQALRHQPDFGQESIIPARSGGPTGIDRLDWVRGHLARVPRQNLTPAERQEMLRLLALIQEDVASLIQALMNDD